jgi:DNA ligase-1
MKYTFATLFKRATTGKVSEWTIETDMNKYRTTSGYSDGAKTTTEWTHCTGKNTNRANETSAVEQAFKEAQALWQKKIDSGYFDNTNDIDKQVFFKPMLAKDWNDYKDDITYPIFSQPKLDGIRCIVSKDGMYTRNGKAIISAPHIFESLKHFFKKNPNLIFDGELYADKFANDFNAICSLVKKTKPTAEDVSASAKSIQYHIYDLPSHIGTFSQRYAEICAMELPDCCVIVETNQVDNTNDVIGFYEDYVNKSYEGQILRLDSKYENKRTKSLLKHKSFQDDEFTILDICEGEGNKMGMVGYMVFETKKGQRFKSNLKADWDTSKSIWKNKKQFVGKTATVQYFNLTPDGIPRFPYITKIAREDYE